MKNKFCEVCEKEIKPKNKKVALRKNAKTCSNECRIILWAFKKQGVKP